MVSNMAGQNYYSPNQFYVDRMRNAINSGYNQPFNPYPNPPVQQTTQTQQNMMPCRPVTSAEEARAALIDAFSPHIFTNFAGNEIYAKYIQNDGTAKFRVFKEIIDPIMDASHNSNDQTPQSNPIEDMKKEFESKIQNLYTQIDQLNMEITSLKKGKEKTNDESTKSSTNSKNGK